MSDRTQLAKLGVLVLLGLNVGAYYVFWPKNNGMPLERAEPKPPSVPTAPIPAMPKNFPVESAKNAEPLVVPSEPRKNESADAAVGRLLDLIQKDNVQPIPVVGEHIEAPPPLPPPIPKETRPFDVPLVIPGPNPRPLPPLKAEPIRDEVNLATDPNIAITSALTQKSQPSPWLVTASKSGTRELLTARLLKSTPPIVFEILCDRVDLKGADGVQALGNVTFVGASIKGACQRLTVPANASSLVFEGSVRIMPTNLRGERIVWELPANDIDINAAEFRPAGVLLPGSPPQGILGSPK